MGGHLPPLLQGFNCIARADARILILGSMPGQASLRKNQYYAHPRNSFWTIMERLFDAGPEHSYEQRLALLQEQRIALWDVVYRCARQGSLDTAIEQHTVVANDFHRLFAACPKIHSVYFNGQKAATLFRQQVLPGLPAALAGLHYQTLPSTSPAHASLNTEQKLQQWSCIKQALIHNPDDKHQA
jgi:hypoxanthine-DNA glycosylase